MVRCCQEAFQFVIAIASCSVLEPQYLGWDLSVKVWDKTRAVPSYKADMKRFSSAHAVPWVITAFDKRKQAPPSVAVAESTCESEDGNSTSIMYRKRRYVMVRCLTFQDTKRLWGRATIAMEVVSLKDWRNKNEDVRPLWWLKQCADLVSDSQGHLYVMKQSWQRLPGLDNGTVSLANSSHTSDFTGGVDRSLETIRQELRSIPFEAFLLRRAQLDSRLKVAGFVWEDGRKVETGNYIRRGISTNPKRERITKSMPGSRLPSRVGSGANTPSQPQATASAPKQLIRSKSMLLKSQTGAKTQSWNRSLHNLSATRQETSHAALVSRTLVRMVLNIPGYTIQHCANMTEFLRGFQGAIEGEIACKPNNIS